MTTLLPQITLQFTSYVSRQGGCYWVTVQAPGMATEIDKRSGETRIRKTKGPAPKGVAMNILRGRQ